MSNETTFVEWVVRKALKQGRMLYMTAEEVESNDGNYPEMLLLVYLAPGGRWERYAKTVGHEVVLRFLFIDRKMDAHLFYSDEECPQIFYLAEKPEVPDASRSVLPMQAMPPSETPQRLPSPGQDAGLQDEEGSHDS